MRNKIGSIIVLLTIIVISGCATGSMGGTSSIAEHDVYRLEFDDLPSANREFRAMYVTTVYGLDWPRENSTVEEQKADAIEILDNAKDLKFNAIVFQVRPAGDVFYKSS